MPSIELIVSIASVQITASGISNADFTLGIINPLSLAAPTNYYLIVTVFLTDEAAGVMETGVVDIPLATVQPVVAYRTAHPMSGDEGQAQYELVILSLMIPSNISLWSRNSTAFVASTSSFPTSLLVGSSYQISYILISQEYVSTHVMVIFQ